jgi:hypothetical protein
MTPKEFRALQAGDKVVLSEHLLPSQRDKGYHPGETITIVKPPYGSVTIYVLASVEGKKVGEFSRIRFERKVIDNFWDIWL